MMKIPVSPEHLQTTIRAALAEDLGTEDVTTNALLSLPMPAKASIIAHENLTIGGLAIVQRVFREVDTKILIETKRTDGQSARAGTVLLTATGEAKSLLRGERVALNFLQHLSGIATLTKKFCQAVQGYSTTILDTRKTIPGLRALEKWAVRLGGGRNHRLTLGEGILIKDNHLALLKSQGIRLSEVCRIAREQGPHGFRICVEAKSLDEVKKVLSGYPDIILLDNMPPAMIKNAINYIKGRALVEISGGVTLSNVQQMAATGANFISVGALTHSAPAVNISMDITPRPKKRPR